MANYKDFDLEINESQTDGGVSPASVPSLGAICTLISGIIIGSVVTGCSDQCITTGCTVSCPTICYDHPKCEY